MKLSLLLIPLLFLSSCTIDWNDEKDKKIAELQKQIQDDTFKKKQECLSLKNIVDAEYKSYPPELIQDVWEIFYSKNKSSCFAIISLTIANNWTNSFRTIVHNILGNKPEFFEDSDSAKKRVEELKWE